MPREVTYKTWIEYATADIEFAECGAKNMYPPPYELICFHCQQCAEKMLKAFLVSCGETPQKTHDLSLLLGECARFDLEFPQLRSPIEHLNMFAVESRYPDGVDLSEYDATRAMKMARTIYEFALQRMHDE